MKTLADYGLGCFDSTLRQPITAKSKAHTMSREDWLYFQLCVYFSMRPYFYTRAEKVAAVKRWLAEQGEAA